MFQKIIRKNVSRFSREAFFSNLTVTLWGPPAYSFSYEFPRKDILRKKSSAVRNSKIKTATPSSRPRGCRQLSGVCKGMQTKNRILRILKHP